MLRGEADKATRRREQTYSLIKIHINYYLESMSLQFVRERLTPAYDEAQGFTPKKARIYATA